MFVGILIVVSTFVTVSVSLVLDLPHLIQLTQFILSLVAALASFITCLHACRRRARGRADHVVLDVLLVGSASGVIAMSSVDALVGRRTTGGVLLSVLVVVQSLVQTGSVAAALRSRTGRLLRQTVALLMACTVAMCLLDVLRCAGHSPHAAAPTDRHRPAAVVDQALSHRSVVLLIAPVAVLHRFITGVCLLVMWKHTPVHSTTAL